MDKSRVKYLFTAGLILLCAQLVFGMPRHHIAVVSEPQDTVRIQATTPSEAASGTSTRRARRNAARRNAALQTTPDSLPTPGSDSLGSKEQPDSTKKRRKKGSSEAFLDDMISGKNTDSLLYDIRNKTVHIYNEGDITYQDMTMKADYMRINMDTKEIYAYGKADSVDGKPATTHPVFEQGSASYTMDTITYNINSKKAKIKGVATQEGEGWLIGSNVKKMPDNTINIQNGKYTTCDQTDHPHFYLSMTKAKVIPGKKVITGPAYLVMEDVPIYFLGIPEGFFPISSGPKSGLLMPTYGEEYTKGFFLRDLGYYFTFGDHMDLAVRGGFYTLGSWEVSAASRYIKRYKYAGNFNFEFGSTKIGEKGEPDYRKENTFRIAWSHTQDPKANPGSTFSASVNFTSSGYNQYAANNINQILSTQTAQSKISYSKNWTGTPFSLSASFDISQVSTTQELSIMLPNISFNVSRFYPLKRRNMVGKARWYEKIAVQYSANMQNSIKAKESELFSSDMLKKMQNGIDHKASVSASYNLLSYINLTPSFNYNEKWYFKRQFKEWDPKNNRQVELDPEFGFWRLYNYSASLSASTIIYGMYDFTKKSRDRKIQAIRHTISPSVSFSFAPNFGDLSYGYQQYVQSDSLGRYQLYSPYANNPYGVPTSGRSASLNFSLSQTLEMKVLSKRDTSGVKKIKLIDELRISASYNLAADSMRLSPISISLRSTIIKNFGINLSVTLDPYRLTPDGKRINKLFFPGRVTSTGWSFNYSFKSRADNAQPAINDINSIPPEFANPYYDPYGQMDPVLRRQYLSQTYYDFSLPWNLGVGYTISYGISQGNYPPKGYIPNVSQSLTFNGSLNITPKTGITFNAGFDIMSKKLTTSSIAITRDLHCWQMSFTWIPFGYHKSWAFNIGVKAASLADLKYDKNQSHYDLMY